MTDSLRRAGACALALAAHLACTSPVRHADWPMHGGADNIRYSPLAQINRDNVAQLQVAWTYDSHDAFKGSEMQSNPVVVDGVLYVTTPTHEGGGGRCGDRAARSGRSTRAAARRPRARFRHRGVTVHDDRVFVTYRNFLWALDRKTGQPIASFGTERPHRSARGPRAARRAG